MKRYIPAVLLATIVALLLSACSSQEINRLADSEFKWSDFLWVQEKAAIFIPVRLQGNPYTWFMQHDTGAPQVHFYGLQYNDLMFDHQVEKKSNGKPLLVSFDGQIGAFDTTNNRFAIRQGYGTPIKGMPGKVTIGTIGLDFFQGKVLLMDFVNARFSVTDSLEKIPADIVDNVIWFPAKGLENNRFIITVKINGQDYDLMYDTGASSLDVSAWDKTLWSELTGKQENDAGVTRSSGPSWGQIIEVLTAPAKADLQLGDLSFPEPEVSYSPAHTNMDAGVGSLGNSLFYDKYMVVFDLINSRFGLVESQKTAYEPLELARLPETKECNVYSVAQAAGGIRLGDLTLSVEPWRLHGEAALKFEMNTGSQGIVSLCRIDKDDSFATLFSEVRIDADNSIRRSFYDEEHEITPFGLANPIYEKFQLLQATCLLPLADGYDQIIPTCDSIDSLFYRLRVTVKETTQITDGSGTSYDCYLVEFTSPMGKERGWYTTDESHKLIRYEADALRLELKPGK